MSHEGAAGRKDDTAIAVLHGHVTAQHCNVTRLTVTRSSFDNDERH